MKYILLTFLFTLSSFGQSAWHPNEGDYNFSLSHVVESYDEFYRGADRRDYPFGEFHQHTTYLSGEYGITDKLAVDFTLGYTYTEATDKHPPTGIDNDSGLSDIRIGLRYQLINEFLADESYMPTISFRIGLILEGTYDTGFPAAAGDGGNGIETSIHIGKVFGDSGFGFEGSFGYRNRNQDIPDEIYGNINFFYSCFDDQLVFYTGYDFQKSLHGMDIGDPGFTYKKFHRTQEISHNLQYGVHYYITESLGVGLTFAHTIDGRNTGIKRSLALTMTYSF